MLKVDLARTATADFEGCNSPADIAQREGWPGWDAGDWVLAAAGQIRGTRPLDGQRERLAALLITGAKADEASAEALGHHFMLLEALFHRLTADAYKAAEAGGAGSAERVDIFLRGALKAQKASVACLGALKALRDQPSPTTSMASTKRSARRSVTTPTATGTHSDFLQKDGKSGLVEARGNEDRAK